MPGWLGMLIIEEIMHVVGGINIWKISIYSAQFFPSFFFQFIHVIVKTYIHVHTYRHIYKDSLPCPLHHCCQSFHFHINKLYI